MRWALIACVVLAACEKMPEPATASSDEPIAAVPQAPTGSPADQVAFIDLSQQGSERFCADVETRADFKGWSATVRDADVHTGNQSVAIAFDIGGVKLEQVVQADNPVYPSVNRLRIGDTVTISGRFTHGNGECIYSTDSFGIALTEVR